MLRQYTGLYGPDHYRTRGIADQLARVRRGDRSALLPPEPPGFFQSRSPVQAIIENGVTIMWTVVIVLGIITLVLGLAEKLPRL